MDFVDFVYTYKHTLPVRLVRVPLNLLRRTYRHWRIVLGEKLGLPVPEEFTMKLEWIKCFDKNPLMVVCADKVKVKDYVAPIIGEEYLIKTLGVYDSTDEIDFQKLPEKFVLKTNNASGTNLIVPDAQKLDKDNARRTLDKWIKNRSFGKKEHEWQYLAIEPKILAEEYIETPDGDLPDYKFFCFNGKVRYAWQDVGRYTKNKARAIFDAEWNRLPLTLFTRNYKGEVPKPQGYEKMVEMAEKLSKPFKQVRVDFYNISGKIYFGEMTFFSGDLIFRPRKWNKIWGRQLNLK